MWKVEKYKRCMKQSIDSNLLFPCTFTGCVMSYLYCFKSISVNRKRDDVVYLQAREILILAKAPTISSLLNPYEKLYLPNEYNHTKC